MVNCEDLTYEDISSDLIVPSVNLANYKNIRYDPPEDIGTFKVRPICFLGGEEFDYGIHYITGSLRLVDNFGLENSLFSFRAEDTREDTRGLPLIIPPPYGTRWKVFNEDRSYCLFSGRMLKYKPKVLKRRNLDIPKGEGFDTYSDVMHLNIELQDFATFQFKRIRVFENYTGQTTYFVMRDVIQKYTNNIDASSIDTLLGDTITWSINGLFVDEVVRILLEREGLTIRFNHQNDSVQLFRIGSGTASIITLNEDDVYDKVEQKSFFLTRSSDIVDNIEYMHYNRKIELKVNVSAGSEAVAVNSVAGPDIKMLSAVSKNGTYQPKIRISGDTNDYTITDIVGNGDFRINPAWKGATNTSGLDAEILTPAFLVIANVDHIQSMAGLLEEPNFRFAGEFHGIIKKSDPMTQEEAYQYAEVRLQRMSQNRIRDGRMESKTLLDMIGVTPPRAGDTVNVNLPDSWRIAEEAVIRQVVLTEAKSSGKGGGGINPDKTTDPLYDVKMSFYDRIAIIDNQLERMFRDIKDTVIISDEVITTALMLYENMILNDCVSTRSPLEVDEEQLCIEDTSIELFDFDHTVDWRTTSPAGTTPIGTPAFTWSLNQSTNSLTS